MAQSSILNGILQVPGDKSISHRALIFSLLSSGRCRISRLSPAQDCLSTIACLKQLGADIRQEAESGYLITAPSLDKLTAPAEPLDAGNSGTTIRLLSGLLAGAKITATLNGDASLRKRPMARILKPLAEMGATVSYLGQDGCAPFTISGGRLTGRQFVLPVASAQVQAALLLAGLQADGQTSVKLPHAARDHTERMFRHIGIPFEQPDPLTTTVRRLETPVAHFDITVAGDISSAAFFMVAAACLRGSRITLQNVGMNSGRTLIIDVLKEMGAGITITNMRELCGEPVADIAVKGAVRLAGATVCGAAVASGIDEIPILALAGAFCLGTLSVKDAHELRVKESDRLAAISDNLKAAGADIAEREDGFDITGTGSLKGGSIWRSHADHRLAMTGMVASLLCDRPVTIDDTACAAVSYPNFQADLLSIKLKRN